LPGGYVGKLPLTLALAACAALALALFLLLRPRTLWLPDEAFREQWERILDTAKPPRRLRLVSPGEGRSLRRNWRGFIISARGPLEREQERQREAQAAEEGAADLPASPLILYPRLALTREHDGALLLALDPWMMFRDFKDPAVSRSRVDSPGGGEGILILPGRDQDARRAWAAQLLQRQSGVFPDDPAAWQAVTEGLFFDNSRFQPGAETYGWLDAMPLLYRSSPAWIYAPLSRIRQQPPLESAGLASDRYPDAEDWHEFGIQAAMLWAVPFGGAQDKLEDLRLWLADPQTQTVIANTLDWIPAHPEGAPYNAISRSARLAYLSSSFIWTVIPPL
jgi:hypothetical protein